jgi:hypothetical protein
MDEEERLPGTGDLVVEPGFVELRKGHRAILA